MENGVLKMEIWRSVCVNLRCGFFALNLKCVLNFFGFFAIVQNDKTSRHCELCESKAWQTIKLRLSSKFVILSVAKYL